MSKTKARLTLDPIYMKKFFERHRRKFFPEAQRLERLEIKRRLTLAREDFIIRYQLTLKTKGNRTEKKLVRGVARADNSKYLSYRAINLLWQRGFSAGNFIVPRPLGYNYRLGQFLYEELPGQTLHRLLENNQSLKSGLRLAASWLAKFHRLRIKSLPKIHSLKDEKAQIKNIGQLFSRLNRYYPALPKNYSRLLEEFWLQEKDYLKPKNFILIHNDFSPGNIIINRQRVGVIDFVEARRFHPLTDLGTLLAYLNSPLSPLISRRFPKAKIEYLENIFLKEYCRRARLDAKKIAPSIILFKTRALLIMAMHLTKLALGWGKNNHYRWSIQKPFSQERKQPLKIYESYQNPQIIELILDQVAANLNQFKESKSLFKAKNYLDLHLHSYLSDGMLGVGDLIKMARARQLKIISLTDHNTIAGVKELIELGQKAGIKVLPGVEIYTNYSGRILHLLGYNFNLGNKALNQALLRSQREENQRIKKIISKLNRLGFEISWPYLRRRIGSKFIDGGHVASVLLDFTTNIKRFEEILGPLPHSKKEAIQLVIKNFISHEKPAYVPLVCLNFKKAVKIIHKAGGSAILAHPGKTFGYLKEKILRDLISLGLDGLEAESSRHTPKQDHYYLGLAPKYGLKITAGTNWHDYGNEKRAGQTLKLPLSIYSKLISRA